MLSFWFSIVLPIIAAIFHLFPWRFILGTVGLVLFGPQNWILRVMRERRSDYKPPDFDKIVKAKKLTSVSLDDGTIDAPLFSSFAPNNLQLYNDDLDTSSVREIVVPYSQLMYQRFYDWPPENEYARVVIEGPPQGDQMKSTLRRHPRTRSSSCEDSVAKGKSSRVKRQAKKIVAGIPLILTRRKNASTY